MNKSYSIQTELRPRVHKILANSYLSYLLALFFGLILSAIFPSRIFTENYMLNISAVVLFLATGLIFWAQKSTRKFKKQKENLTKRSFKNGPYKYTRHPTNLGLFFSLLSFGVIINSVFVILFSIFAFLLARLVFARKEESLLAKKYGNAYLEYKKEIKF
jgi:protein-S-isoprenylcysteine O-methyltransferase Ste14